MKKLLLLFLSVFVFTLSTSTYGQVFKENWDGIGPGISGWSLYNQDASTVSTSLTTPTFGTAAWVTSALEFDNKVAISTSWYATPGSSNDWLVSPSIALPTGTNTLYWDGQAYDPSYPDSYKVYISTTGNAPANFSTVAININPESGGSWTHHTLDLSAYSGQTIYIAFQNYSNDKYLLALDNISVINNATCDQPERDMGNSSTTTTSLTLGWNPITGATGYDIALGAAGFTPTTATYSSSTNSKNITGLIENSRYQFYVRNSCVSAWVGPNSCFTAKNLPYVYGFDTVGGFAQDGWFGSWNTSTTAANAQAGTQYLFSNNSTAVTNRSVYSRPLALHTGEVVTVSFYHRETSATAARSLRLRVINEATPTVSSVIWSATGLQSMTYALVTAPVYTATADGTYYFEFNDFSPIVTAANVSSMRLDSVNITSVLGTSEFLTSKFAVSPNPANDFISVSNSDNILVSGISITDLNGRVVKQNSYTNVSDIQVNVSDLASGMYMMNITTDKGSVTKKIVKN